MDTKTSAAFRLTFEKSLYLIAFGLGLSLRLLRLGATPLSDHEASFALQALALARGLPAEPGAQPAYLAVTSLLFALIGDTNGLARLWSAVTGSLLPLFPLFFGGLLASSARMRRAGIILAFGLALDPGLVALSRLAGSPMAALSLSVLALGAAFARKPRLTGILAGLALLSGPSLLQGLLALGLTWLAWAVLLRSELVQRINCSIATVNGPNSTPEKFAWKEALIYGAGATLLVGTMLLRLPQGLGALMNILPAYLQNWQVISDVPALRLPAALLLYQPLALIAGLATAFVGWARPKSDELADQLSHLFSLWALLALFAGMILPGRQVSDIAWAIFPLWALAALGLSADLNLPESTEQAKISLGHAGLNILFFVLAWHNLLRIQYINAGAVMMAAISGGILLMFLVAAVLTAAGWSPKTAWLGVCWGISACLVFFTFYSAWSAAQISHAEARPGSAVELWGIGPAAGDVNLLTNTLADLSGWKTGQRYELDLAVMVDSPAIRWALRNFINARFSKTIPTGDLPSVILAYQTENLPALASGYRGQDFAAQVQPAWTGALPDNLLNWLTYRQAPTLSNQIILWARSDLFPGGDLESVSQAQPETMLP